jgi:hypothetical protein
MNKHLGSFLFVASITTMAGCYVDGQAGVQGTVVAPAPVVEVDVAPPPPPPARVVEVRPGFIYVEGRYEWRGGRHVWVDGRYERERRGYRYVQGRWDRRGRRPVWVEGRWVR